MAWQVGRNVSANFTGELVAGIFGPDPLLLQSLVCRALMWHARGTRWRNVFISIIHMWALLLHLLCIGWEPIHVQLDFCQHSQKA